MISKKTIKDLSNQFQAREDNIVREYVQHLFLSYLYQIKESQNLLFKGGTALRIIYQSPRFSEDLDFSSINFNTKQEMENIFINCLSQIEKGGIEINLKEAKFTSGGYLGIISYQLYDFEGEIFFEVSFRENKQAKGEIELIASDYIPAYTLTHLFVGELVREKISALKERKKLRDYYDLYFILRHSKLNGFVNKKELPEIKEKLQATETDFKKGLEALLPVNQRPILKGFKDKLILEIDRYG